MVQVKDLTELKVEDLWREVKGEEEDWWGDLKQETLRVVKRLLESAMEEELLECLRVGRYRRTELRRGYRNGYRQRSLLTELGLVERLRVPRDREGSYQPTVVERYQHPPGRGGAGPRAWGGSQPPNGVPSGPQPRCLAHEKDQRLTGFNP